MNGFITAKDATYCNAYKVYAGDLSGYYNTYVCGRGKWYLSGGTATLKLTSFPFCFR